MENDNENLVSIGQLSRKLKISVVWLKAQADKGILPCINVDGKLLFNLKTIKIHWPNLQQRGTTIMVVESPQKIAPALLTISQVCEYLNIARATFYKLNSTGAFGLLPVKLGTCRKILYRKDEIEHWIQTGCPHRKIWQAQRKEAKS
ncbi:MAG: helix-turn-helix transcriptional regulator [Planctomycetota bacterium]|jgi:excisionase family DNA binding protein